MSSMWVVAVASQVEVASREGERAETRRDLFERLATTFLRDVRYANDVTSRAALDLVLSGAVEDDPTLSKLDGREGVWEQVVDSVGDAIGTLHELGVDAGMLDTVDDSLTRVLGNAIRALDVRLSRAGLVDERRRRAQLGEALACAEPSEIARVVGASSLRAKHLLHWGDDAVWWKPLVLALRRVGGDVTVELPAVVKPIDAARSPDPFEAVGFDAARALDEAPVEVPIQSVFGDMTFTNAVPTAACERVSIRRALDAEAQARAVVVAVTRAVEEGVAMDRIAVGAPRGVSKAALSALKRQFEDAGVAIHVGARDEVDGALVDVAFALLTVGAEGLPRRDVAALLGSRMLDASALSGMASSRAAREACLDLAETLDRTPSAEGSDPLARLVATALARESPARDRRAALARRVGHALMTFAGAVGRASRARAARSLFAEVGLHAGASADVRTALARDERPEPLTRCELHAYARDARSLEAIATALDDLERASSALETSEEPCSTKTFVHELRRALHARHPTSAARATAIRVDAIEDLAREALDLLVVIDANAGVLPTRDVRPALVTPTLEALERRGVHRGAVPSGDLVALAASTEHTSRIVLCYRLADDDGALLAPSPLVSWLERGGVPTTVVHGTPMMGTPATSYERTLALVALAPDRARQLAPHAARVASREAVREAFHAGQAPASDGASIRGVAELSSLLEIETGGGAQGLSVTAVERLARCGYQGFAAQVLGALDDDPRTDDVPDRREEGILTHEALAAAFTAAAPLFRERPRDRDAIERAARAAADGVLARDGAMVVRASLDRIRLEVQNLVALAIDDEAWDFFAAEQGFGRDGWPAFVVEDEHTRVALRGRIDRVDVAHDGSSVRAIDYKRRVTLPAIADLGGAAIQVPIYALVAQRALKTPSVHGRYLSTISPARSSTKAFDDRFAAVVRASPDGSSEASRMVIELVRALRAGDIAPRPSSSKWCEQCGLDGACRRPRFAMALEQPQDQEGPSTQRSPESE